MASSIRLILRKKPNKEGLFPLMIRIVKNRKSNVIYTGHYIESHHWDEVERKIKKSHPNSVRLNNMLVKKLAEASDTVIELQTTHKEFSSKQIKKQIVKPNEEESFNTISKNFLLELEANKKLTRLGSDKPRINHVINFAGSDNLSFREINEDFLKDFITYLKVKRKNSPRSITNNLVVIRTLFNIAIRKGIVDSKLYPFGKGKIRIKFPETEKVGLSPDEVKKIASLNNLTEHELHARNVWLFSFYLAGMRVADVLKIKWSDIYDERLHYRMNKNDKLLSLKLPNKVLPIIESYKEQKLNDNDFIFPELKKANLKSEKDILAKTKTANKKFNKYLEKIAEKAGLYKKLTMHIARHTFGNISGDKIPIQMLQKLYRHSSITTTINYQSNFVHKDTDDALDKVIDF
ncbi:site-specific integrase [Polaribacter sp. MSW13]|uniref:Site-specific integrase n=1 Tax=Polaribacter marinus TaxID=2916838 RepID=A0A9X1VQF8_9FLAO|nr:site-specific integrase [Polaribacter marinus]MCI2229958.1 site-specific integrase [Polaribacter marinus]